MASAPLLSTMWSATGFDDPELDRYAEEQIRADTRRGVQLVAGLSILAQICVAAVVLYRGASSSVIDTNVVVGVLSAHILLSAAFVRDVRALQMLGMTFLILGALAITVLAHRTGDLGIGMMAAVIMLIVAIPLVPWALREAVIVVALTYFLLTMSLIGVPGRFDTESLVVLQLLVSGSAIVALVVTGRNTLIRKHDLRARYELEHARERLSTLSMKDHLTGAWNRRYLDEQFPKIVEECRKLNRPMQLAVLDIDDFKGINDQFGHHAGDQILTSMAEIFMASIGDRGVLIRLGGDEFQILYQGKGLGDVIDSAVSEVQNSVVVACFAGERTITLSAGIVDVDVDDNPNPDELYKTADKALYAAKQRRRPARADGDVPPSLVHTGTWQI
ncbi:MAG: diguanylate cyclase [Woeseiaceae bacterium]|nr:diguanylate cyclase [Woeseiaceae bacterium]